MAEKTRSIARRPFGGSAASMPHSPPAILATAERSGVRPRSSAHSRKFRRHRGKAERFLWTVALRPVRKLGDAVWPERRRGSPQRSSPRRW